MGPDGQQILRWCYVTAVLRVCARECVSFIGGVPDRDRGSPVVLRVPGGSGRSGSVQLFTRVKESLSSQPRREPAQVHRMSGQSTRDGADGAAHAQASGQTRPCWTLSFTLVSSIPPSLPSIYLAPSIFQPPSGDASRGTPYLLWPV